ncbi:MAG: peptidylprolyl isomerase [Rikenellaceae bacterium]
MKKILSSLFVIISVLTLYSCGSSGDVESVVTLETSMGVISVKLYNDTPLHKANFEKMVSEGVYDGMLFHRVIDNFMIQAGDPTSKGAAPDVMLGEDSFGEDVDNEISSNHFHKKGVLAAAREGNGVNPERKSSGSHFYIARGRIFEQEELMQFVVEVNEKRHKAFLESEDPKATEVPLTLSAEQIEAYTTVGGIPHLDGEYTIFGEVVEGLEVLDKIIVVDTDDRDRPVEDVIIKKATIIR